MIEDDFRFQADLDEVGDHLHVVRSMGVAVHTERHEKVLSWTGQLQTKGFIIHNRTLVHCQIQFHANRCIYMLDLSLEGDGSNVHFRPQLPMKL